MNAPHDTVAAPVQVPWPSQAPGVVCIPAVHEALAPHAVPAGQLSHAPAWHLPSLPQVAGAVMTQIARGSGPPSIAAAQTPFAAPVSAAEHAWHAPSQASSQQKPSTQKPLWHWALTVHVEPWTAPPALLEAVIEDDVVAVPVAEPPAPPVPPQPGKMPAAAEQVTARRTTTNVGARGAGMGPMNDGCPLHQATRPSRFPHPLRSPELGPRGAPGSASSPRSEVSLRVEELGNVRPPVNCAGRGYRRAAKG
jgi:hypothetical protein